MILEILIIAFFIYSVFISYLSVVAIRKINQYESFLLSFQQTIEYATEKMKTVDSLGHYEADDETGFFFKQIKEIQELLNSIFETEKGSDNIEEVKEKE